MNTRMITGIRVQATSSKRVVMHLGRHRHWRRRGSLDDDPHQQRQHEQADGDDDVEQQAVEILDLAPSPARRRAGTRSRSCTAGRGPEDRTEPRGRLPHRCRISAKSCSRPRIKSKAVKSAPFSDSWRGFRGVKPLKSLRPYGTVHGPSKAHGRWGAGCFAPQRLPEPSTAPISRGQTRNSRGLLPRIPERTPWPTTIFSSPAPAWTGAGSSRLWIRR